MTVLQCCRKEIKIIINQHYDCNLEDFCAKI